jgi:hypothetical protein
MNDKSSNEKKQIWILRHKWSSIVIAVIAVLVAYVVAITFLSSLVDEDSLRKAVEEYVSYQLGTDVSVDEVNAELTYGGKWRLRLRDMRVESPSPDYNDPIFVGRKLTFVGSLFKVLAQNPDPEVVLKDFELFISADSSGNININDLFQPREVSAGEWDGWPFSYLLSKQINFSLDNGSIIIRATPDRPEWQTGTLNGKGKFIPAGEKQKIASVKINIAGPVKKGAPQDSSKFSLNITNLSTSMKEGLKGSWKVGAKLKEVPMQLASNLAGLPPISEDAIITYGEGEIKGRFRGKNFYSRLYNCHVNVKKLDIPLFGAKGPMHITYNTENIADKKLQKTSITIREEKGENLASINFEKEFKNGKIKIMTITTKELDVSNLRYAGKMVKTWKNSIVPELRNIKIDAGNYRLLGLSVKNAQITAKVKGRTVKEQKVTGSLAGGEFCFVANNWNIEATGWPQAMGTYVKNANAPELAKQVKYLAARNTIPQASEGRISVALSYPCSKAIIQKLKLEGDMQKKFVIAKKQETLWQALVLVKKPLIFTDPADNEFLRSLWKIPAGLKKAENILSKTEEKEKPPAPLGTLNIKSGYLGATVHLNILQIKSTGLFKSKELGDVKISHKFGKGLREHIWTVTTHPLTMGNINAEKWLKPETIRKIKKVEKTKGLKIIINHTKGKTSSKDMYISDITQMR